VRREAGSVGREARGYCPAVSETEGRDLAVIENCQIPANSLPAARGYGDTRRPKASCRENSSKSTFSYRTPVQQVGCVAKTHRDAERCVIASSTHPTGSRPTPAGARPGSTPRLNQGGPPCSSPGLATGPLAGVGGGLGPFSGCVNSAFLNISQHFTGHLFRLWISGSTRCQYFRPRSDRFWLLEQRVSRTFLDFSRPQLSGHGYPGDAPTVGDWETVGRRGRAGQETLSEPAQQIR
jgi:hypothetical protein